MIVVYNNPKTNKIESFPCIRIVFGNIYATLHGLYIRDLKQIKNTDILEVQA